MAQQKPQTKKEVPKRSKKQAAFKADPTTSAPERQNAQGHPLMGVVIGALIVCLVLILGGLYLWGSMLDEQAGPTQDGAAREIPNNEPETPRAEADVQALQTMSSSDELSAIEADLANTMLELDEELSDIDAVFEGELQAQ